MVETLMKSPVSSETDTPKPKAAIYLSKTEILLKKDEPRSEFSLRDQSQDLISKSEYTELISNASKNEDQIQDIPNGKFNGTAREDNYSQKSRIPDIQVYERKDEDIQFSNEYYSNKNNASNEVIRNGGMSSTQSYVVPESSQPDVPVGKFRAFPVSLKESEGKSAINNMQSLEMRSRKSQESSAWGNGRPPHSDCEESEDEDSHSTLSHRTEDSHHTTTDDCLSDATTDSFEKPRLVPEPPNMQRSIDDNASTEGYLSDASTDVSIRRFTNRSLDLNAYSTEEYLSDATAESPDPDWIINRGTTDYSRSK